MAYLSALLFFLFSFPATANQSRISQVETYLNALKTYQADFVQINPDGESAEGNLLLQRPGKMRWNYKTPSEVTMITRGSDLLYYDKLMDEVTYLPLDDVAAAMLIRDEVNLRHEAYEVAEFEEKDGILRLTMRQNDAPDHGEFTLKFRSSPLKLYGIELNQQGQVTRMSLQNIKQNDALPADAFIFENPRGLVDPARR